MRRAALLLALALPFAASAQPCPAGSRIDTAAAERRLQAAEALWRRNGPGAYRLSGWEQASNFPKVEWKVEVQPGLAPRGWTREAPRQTGPAAGRAASYRPVAAFLAPTVPALFARVRSALRGARASGSCGVLTVAYDPRDGHVRSLESDNFGQFDEQFLVTAGPVLPRR